MRVLIVLSVFIAYVAAQAQPPAVPQQEIKKAVDDIVKGADNLNVTITKEDKKKLAEGLDRLANFDIDEHPQIKQALQKIKDRVPELKEKVCRLAKKADEKIKPVSDKVGAGITKGFQKLGSEKFPAGVARFKKMYTDAAQKGNRADLIAVLDKQADKIQQCMTTRLNNISGPLGNVVKAAGAEKKDVFRKMLKPFGLDVEDCGDLNRRR